MRFMLLALAGCASLHRTPTPARASPPVVVVTGSFCPEYRLAVHEDGLVEYWADRTAEIAGPGWLRVDAAVVERLRGVPLGRPRQITDVELQAWCRAVDVSSTGLAIRGSDGWTAQCEVRPEREAEVLSMLGVSKWLRPKEDERCRWGA